jgi:hypothetical protein
MDERDFQLDGRSYKLNKVDAFKQFHLVRRMGPLLSELFPAMKKAALVTSKKELTESEKYDQLADIAGPLLSGFSKLTDKDADFILMGLLSAVEVQQEGAGWARVATDVGLMFNNLDLPTMLQLAGRALMYNVGNFSRALPLALEGAKLKQKGR